MGKYLLLWEVDQARAPISPQERGAGWGALIDMVKEDLRKGVLKDWGTFVGEINGYSVAEGTEVEIGNMIQRYVPWVIFKTRAVASVNQVDEIVKALTK
jgi:hypothetical protein